MQNVHNRGLPVYDSDKTYDKNMNLFKSDKYNKYEEAHSEAEKSRSLINSRIDRLKLESEALKNQGKSFLPRRINPDMYSYQVVEPIYYPLENPIRGEPLTLPKIEMGIPVQKSRSKEKKNTENKCKNKCKHKNGFSISELFALLSFNKLGYQNNNSCSQCHCQPFAMFNQNNIPNNNNNNNNNNCFNHCSCHHQYVPNERVNHYACVPDPRLLMMNYEMMYRTPIKGIPISRKQSPIDSKSIPSSRIRKNSLGTRSSADSSRQSSNVRIKNPPLMKKKSTNSVKHPPIIIEKKSSNLEKVTLTPEQEPPEQKPLEEPTIPASENQIISRKSTVKIPTQKTIELPKKSNLDLWKVARNFVNMNKFLSFSKMYAENANSRDQAINEITSSILQDIETVSNWLLSIEDSFINELKVFNNLNINYKDPANKNPFKKCAETIVSLITKFITNLMVRTSKVTDIPDKIYEILNKYIKENGYLPKKYLSTFEINRLNFNLNGALKNINDNQAAMILTFLMISRCIVQKVLLLPKQSLPQFKNSNNIQPSCFILGTVLHYLVKRAYATSPPKLKEFLSLLNYYRNYGITKKEIESEVNKGYTTSIDLEDIDEISKNLIPENDLNQFWNENAAWAESCKQKIYIWGVNIVKFNKLKYTQPRQSEVKKETIKR